MPELPDIEAYCIALQERIVGARLQRVRLKSPFLLRTAVPPVEAFEGRTVRELRRLGKRIVLGFDDAYFAVLHLMIAGRLRWLTVEAKPPGRITLAVFDFDLGQLAFTEAGSKRRASLHLVHGETALAALDPGGVDVFDIDAETFAVKLTAENRTLKRALTDPRSFSGIGNAYSDEILHRARLSPLQLTRKLAAEESTRLYHATREVLREWMVRLGDEARAGFPEKVTAFRPEMAVHGRFGKPCPVCGAPVQRIVHADNEMNYCARCQTGGRILADRALSRLLHDTFPRHLDEL